MKHLLLVLAMLLPLTVSCKPSKCQIRCGTFNIRLQNDGDEKAGYGWSVRKDRVANYIKDNHIEVVGMQEVLHAQLEDLLERLPEYDYVGVGRTDGKTKGEYSPIFFLKDKFEVLEKGNFWLSETPEVPGSKGWDAALERIASYAKLKDKRSGKVFMAAAPKAYVYTGFPRQLHHQRCGLRSLGLSACPTAHLDGFRDEFLLRHDGCYRRFHPQCRLLGPQRGVPQHFRTGTAHRRRFVCGVSGRLVHQCLCDVEDENVVEG